jgi:hypothetical protein
MMHERIQITRSSRNRGVNPNTGVWAMLACIYEDRKLYLRKEKLTAHGSSTAAYTN